MKARVTLTFLWVASFAISAFVVFSYTGTTREGMKVLLDEQLGAALKPLCLFYGGYLAGILASWFAKPFKPLLGEEEKVRFWLAVTCTVLLNLPVLWMLMRWHLADELRAMSVLQDVDQATDWGLMASFLVAPVNLYYFGIRPNSAG